MEVDPYTEENADILLVDLINGAPHIHLTDILSFLEDLSESIRKNVDVYEIHEVDEGSSFHEEIMKEK